MAGPDNQNAKSKQSLAATLDLARTAWAAGDYERALEHAEIAALGFPKFPQGAILMAQSLAALDRVDECMTLLRRTIADHPESQKLLGFARNIATMYGRFDDALESSLKLLDLNPRDPKSHAFLSFCYTGLGRIDLASQHLATLSDMDKSPQVNKLSVYVDEYYRLKKTLPSLVSAWESCLLEKTLPTRIGGPPQERIPIIQYWSQGVPPADVAQVMANWNRILRNKDVSRLSF